MQFMDSRQALQGCNPRAAHATSFFGVTPSMRPLAPSEIKVSRLNFHVMLKSMELISDLQEPWPDAR